MEIIVLLGFAVACFAMGFQTGKDEYRPLKTTKTYHISTVDGTRTVNCADVYMDSNNIFVDFQNEAGQTVAMYRACDILSIREHVGGFSASV